MDIRRQVAAAAGSPVTDIAPLGGGCVSAVYDVRLGDGRHVVAKVDESRSDTLATEGFMLRYLAAQTALPVPAVVAEGSGVLLTEYIEGDSRFDGAAEADAAERLAALHALTAPTFGFERDTLIGGLRQPNNPTAVWLDFFAEQRLIFMAGQAARAGRCRRSPRRAP
ncbi:MAG TPA: fructosamine kinase family protein, partial [Promineifilum sp.]|nr:fructosamine kinase family protein [Promineifilum sp.]